MSLDCKVSIVTATYNSEHEILETYESIRSQTYENWEWLVTDDCSSDKTLDVLNEISKSDSRVRVLKNRINSGAAVSRNNSLSYASGDFLAFIDSDDLWYSTKLEIQLLFMINKQVSFSFTAYELIDEAGTKLGSKVDASQSGGFSYRDMLKKKATLGCSTVILKKSAFSDITMPDLRTGQDYATWLKLLRNGEQAFICSEVLTQYRIRPNSISRNKFKKAIRQWKIYREVERLPLFYSLYCFFFYAWRAVFRA
ncbi:glycosyltransferase family 2 protein [Vibrio owensii]|uniref:glycosyltransferase family 2 protein n=1 Tax=Vibrio owensii TaxID=696485 RepID=UPI0039199026